MDEEGNSVFLEKARRYCSGRETCRTDLQKKLLGWGMGVEKIPGLIHQMEEEGFLDELRYAKAVAHDQYQFNKWGRNKIRYFLKQHGISQENVHEALQNIDQEEYIRMIRSQIREKEKHTRFNDSWDRRNKLMRFAISRGYEAEIVLGMIGGGDEPDSES